jgi:hypothetical protein
MINLQYGLRKRMACQEYAKKERKKKRKREREKKELFGKRFKKALSGSSTKPSLMWKGNLK